MPPNYILPIFVLDIQDIVTASYALDLDEFIPKLREYLTVVNPYKRQFLISWISVLASVPDIDMLQYLPELLEGLMGMLSDTNREIRQATGKALQVHTASSGCVPLQQGKKRLTTFGASVKEKPGNHCSTLCTIKLLHPDKLSVLTCHSMWCIGGICWAVRCRVLNAVAALLKACMLV